MYIDLYVHLYVNNLKKVIFCSVCLTLSYHHFYKTTFWFTFLIFFFSNYLWGPPGTTDTVCRLCLTWEWRKIINPADKQDVGAIAKTDVEKIEWRVLLYLTTLTDMGTKISLTKEPKTKRSTTNTSPKKTLIQSRDFRDIRKVHDKLWFRLKCGSLRKT